MKKCYIPQLPTAFLIISHRSHGYISSSSILYLLPIAFLTTSNYLSTDLLCRAQNTFARSLLGFVIRCHSFRPKFTGFIGTLFRMYM